MTYNSKKLVCGKGRKGNSPAVLNGKTTKAYRTWAKMRVRCYNTKYHLCNPTYIGCSVCEEWLCFPTFKTWFDKNYEEGWQLDKDLLVNGNKVYGPSTCIFVPPQINTLFIDCGRKRGEYPIGVSFYKRMGKFEAQIHIDGKNQYLGYFADAEDAHKAYLIAKKENVLRMAEKWKDKIPPKLYEVLIRKANEYI